MEKKITETEENTKDIYIDKQKFTDANARIFEQIKALRKYLFNPKFVCIEMYMIILEK